jgi:DNA-nicking Smr family endonuclease
MVKKTKVSKEDLATFHKAVEGTKPLKHDKIRLTPPPLKIRKQQVKFDDDELNLNEALDINPVQGEEFINFKQNSISNKILRKLRKGQYNVDAILDLHGMSVDKAKHAVYSFLQQCLHEGIRVVLIIHGKGHHSKMPILKNKLNHWLREINVVLAFCSASPSHGSRGAMYVLLKRNAEENMRG